MMRSWGGTSSSSQVDIEAQHTLSFSCVSLRSLLSVLGTQNTVFRNVEVVMNAITQKMLCIRGCGSHTEACTDRVQYTFYDTHAEQGDAAIYISAFIVAGN